MKQIFTLFVFIGFHLLANCQSADFNFVSTNGSYCNPSTIRFTQTASGNPIGYVWTFGNNTGSNLQNPLCSYANAGTYRVKLIVIYKKSTLQVTKDVVINPSVNANFQTDRSNICMPGTVSFTSTTPGNIARYEWDFGDSGETITTTSPTVNHNFTDYNSYTVSLKATAATGCYATSNTTITVRRPVVGGDVNPVSGCIPTTSTFNASVNLFQGSTVNSYTWNYGDGSANVTSTSSHASHSYTNAGTYYPTLHVVTNEGCNNDYSFPPIAFGFPPTNHVAYPRKTIFCGSEMPAFIAKADNANRYLWDFGQADTVSVYDTIMTHKFKTLGIKQITVTPYYNDCPGTPVQFSVNVIGVISGFQFANTCIEKNKFTFNNTSQGNQSVIKWTFGDGSPESHAANNLLHIYPDTGTYLTTLYLYDSITSCSDNYSINIYTAKPQLSNTDNAICKNSSTTFTIPNNYNNPRALYEWNVLGNHIGNSLTNPLDIIANMHGYFNNNFVVIDNGPQYCPDTIRLNRTILVRGPQIDFSSPDKFCLGSSYQWQNLSTSFVPSENIHTWHWDYGIPGQEDSVYQPPAYTCPYWGTYTVTLTGTDINGCIDSIAKPFTAYDLPFLVKIPDLDTLCAGQSATLIAFHNDSISWTPTTSISCNTCDTIVVAPIHTTTYFVSTTSKFGCTKSDSIKVFVYEPFTAKAENANNFLCQSQSKQLKISPADKITRWQPAYGLSDSTLFNPMASPKQTTEYTVTLADSVGCFTSTAIVKVTVNSLPTVEAGTSQTLPYRSNFSLAPIYSSNVRSYLWSPASLLDCSNCPNPNGIAESSQTYTVKVISDSGCVAADNVSIFVECKGANLLLPTAFSPNNDGQNDYFYPITRGIQKIKRFSIYNRQGQMVYDARDFSPNVKNIGWDGKFKGLNQEPASYVYIIEAVCEIGQQVNSKGSFVLVR